MKALNAQINLKRISILFQRRKTFVFEFSRRWSFVKLVDPQSFEEIRNFESLRGIEYFEGVQS